MSHKSTDNHGRWRSVTQSFRASPEEVKAIDEAVALSGLTKQEYAITKLTNRDVVVVGNPRVFINLKHKMEEIYQELLRLESVSEVSDEFLDTINLVAKIFNGMIRSEEDN